jgi:hypothetical protein
MRHAVQPTTRTKFDARVDFVKDRDGVSRSVALQRARLEYPDDYESFQAFHTGTSTQEQYARRGGWGNNVGKRAGPATYEDLLVVEMRKGLNAECAAQRVAQQFGFRAFDFRDMRKSEARAVTAENALIAAATDIWTDSDLTRCEALRKARLDRPDLHRRMMR